MIRIVAADDSALLRQVLKDTLEKTGKVQVVASVKNGKEVVQAVADHKPDLAILDVEMPVMNGLEALRAIMEENPLPVIMFSSLTREGASVTIKALELGAADFFLKPSTVSKGLDDLEQDLLKKIQTLVTRHRVRSQGSMSVQAPKIVDESAKVSKLSRKRCDLIAIGSSTGGVQAAMKLVAGLNNSFPPIVWVQHMPATFTGSFATRLDSLSSLSVKEAVDGEVLKPGHCYIAPGGYQMRVVRKGVQNVLRIAGQEKVSGFCPSCDVLFESVAQVVGGSTLGIILTGMGHDGTEGLGHMKKKGSYVVGQDEASCVVYGMPRSAFEAGSVDVQLSLENISKAITKICG